MNANALFQKALLLLGSGRDQDREVVLREAIAIAKTEGASYALGQSLACLGDLLFRLERPAEAKEILLEFMAHASDEDDVLDFERQRVKELLTALK
ncbi:MAG TPA: hypothetical protein VFE47_30200 [Tepidisphaeraceae bacterium]|jgi:hypothetical protein|nr:hypothetical protein [Tepidisphaeraceae bacterium]